MEDKVLKRSEIPEELTWRLEDIYPEESGLEADISEAMKLADELAAFEGKLGESAQTMLNAFELYEKGYLLLNKAYRYAHMRGDQDTADSKYQAMEQKALSAWVQTDAKIAFLSPEILEIPEETMERFLKEAPGLSRYAVTLKEIRRMKPHTLSKEMETLLASAGEVMASPEKGFSMLSDADMKFPSVKDSAGKEVPLSHGRFVPTLMSEDRGLRKNAFEAFYGRLAEFRNTFAALYDAEVKTRVFRSRARKYGSCFEAAVDGNDVDPKVCDRLFEAVHAGMDHMYRYVALRKKLLGVDELHMYDIYTSMIADQSMKVSYEEAKAITLEALKPLGEDYLNTVREAYENRWIDVLENEGKRSGAYSEGVYGVHPYMLLNYTDTLDDVFTLIHEMGHSMHTWYSDHAQTLLDSEYKIFVAEVASTTNEVLLYYYLKDHAKTKEEKAYIINHFLESFRTTLYRQTMFEEFERKTAEMAEAGEPLTADSIEEVYYGLNKLYFGDGMTVDELIKNEWARIPHFYYNFYVYQYATSFAAAVTIASRILKEGEPVVKKYKEFLSSGCTSDPVSLLKIAGVDLTTAQPIEDA
ncbi:MAG: oligoendopeptidase F, partial [Lachnospiraceae bacterium]|nr:oligoendopeptidase F [Lachnospiraceae bacterium]